MNHAEDRFGSAAFASLADMRRAGIIGGQGPAIGFDSTGTHPLVHPGDASIAIFGGAGSGKSAGFFAQNLLSECIPGNALVFDPRGELAAISKLARSLLGHEVRTINPTGMPWCAQDRCNPLDHLTINSPGLVADTQKLFIDLIAMPASDRKAWWVDIARMWCTALTLYLVERSGITNLQEVYELINVIEGNRDAWCDVLEGMVHSRFPEVRREAGNMMAAQTVGRESWSSPITEIYTSFAFMQDPRIADALGGSDFSMQELVDPHKKLTVFIVVPIEYLSLWRPAIRALIGSAIQSKLRNPAARRVSILIDEAGQLGPFPSIRELYTFCRGAGLQGICAWQEIAQIIQAFGREGADEIMSSAQIRAFSGTRTLETASVVSRMAGTQTLPYNETLKQSEAQMAKRAAARKVLAGGSLREAAAELEHYARATTHMTKQARALITADEMLNLGPGKMITFASGLLHGPIMGLWKNYFKQPALAGRYLPNPWHDPDHVQIAGRLFTAKKRIVEEAVPTAMARLPQYAGGSWQYVEGYRPRV